jgi:hypothetical protein
MVSPSGEMVSPSGEMVSPSGEMAFPSVFVLFPIVGEATRVGFGQNDEVDEVVSPSAGLFAEPRPKQSSSPGGAAYSVGRASSRAASTPPRPALRHDGIKCVVDF